MISIRRAFVLFLSIITVQANQPDVGFLISINPGSVKLQFDRVYTITYDLHYQRLASRSTSITVDTYISKYLTLNDTDIDSVPIKVGTFTTQTSVTATDFTRETDFQYLGRELLKNAYISLVVVNDNATAGIEKHQTEGAILTFDTRTGHFGSASVSEYEHDLNVEFTNESNAFIIIEETETIDPPQKPIGAPVPPAKVEGKDGIPNIDPPSTTKTTSHRSSTSCSSSKTTKAPTHPTYFPMYGHGGVEEIEWVTETVRNTETVCPSQPPPPPCSTGVKHLEYRQHFVGTFFNAEIRYRDRTGIQRPVRHLVVSAIGTVFSASSQSRGDRRSRATVNAQGRARFRFNLLPGERIIVHRLETLLVAKTGLYTIATWANVQQDFLPKIVPLRLLNDPWLAKAGETKSYISGYPSSQFSRALWVADAFQFVTDYARREVVPLGTTLPSINAWYPGIGGPADPAFFTTPGVYINLPADRAFFPEVSGHEYGHYIHYLARNKLPTFSQGGPHQFCGTLFPTGVDTMFEEGLSTAFGLLAIDNTHLAPAYGTYRGTDMEAYRCPVLSLHKSEGRIAAALFDLGDRRLDSFAAATGPLGNIWPGFTAQGLNIKFKGRSIFWDPLVDNPNTMIGYWYAFQAQWITKNPAAEQKAWNVLDYHFASADFSHFKE